MPLIPGSRRSMITTWGASFGSSARAASPLANCPADSAGGTAARRGLASRESPRHPPQSPRLIADAVASSFMVGKLSPLQCPGKTGPRCLPRSYAPPDSRAPRRHASACCAARGVPSQPLPRGRNLSVVRQDCFKDAVAQAQGQLHPGGLGVLEDIVHRFLAIKPERDA